MAALLRQASARYRTDEDGRSTWHSFSFGAHYDPDNIGFGSLIAHNDEHLPASGGYADHPHADVEIVSFVVSGTLRHTSTVGSGELGPGGVQRLSAGSGVVHAEFAAHEPTRFVQTWIRPATSGGTPSYASRQDLATASESSRSGLVPLAGGDAGLSIGAEARLFWAAGAVQLPDAALLHVFCFDGTASVEEGPTLATDDQLRITGEPGRRLQVAGQALIWAL